MRFHPFVFFLPATAKGFQQHLPQQRLQRSATLGSATQLFSSMSSTLGRYRFLRSNDESNCGGIRKIVDDYDVFLLDMWGVMHDGIQPYEGVPEVVQQLKDAGKKLIILSNSSKRRQNSVKMLSKLGFEDDAFDEIITSGEVAHHLLLHLSSSSEEPPATTWVPKNIPAAFQQLKDTKTVDKPLSAFCFGSGDGDEEYLNSCGWNLSRDIESADLIVSRGTFVVLSEQECADKKVDEESYWSAYQEALEQASKRDKPPPMVVCNPDKVRPDASKSPMPGTIGVAYQELLQTNNNNSGSPTEDLILSLGKPFSSVYEIAMASIENNGESARVIMVGDALETDVTGANTAGIDSVWVVKDGIHNEDIVSEGSSLEEGCEAVLQDFNKRSEETYAKGRTVSPTVVLPHFRW